MVKTSNRLRWWSRMISRQKAAIAVVALVAVTGIYLLIQTHALSPYVANTASSGSLAGPTAFTDAAASGGQYVQFSNTYTTAVSKLTGLTEWSMFNETSGSIAHDSSPSKINGTFSSSGVSFNSTGDTLAGSGVQKAAVNLASGTGSISYPNNTAFNLSTTSTTEWLVMEDVQVTATSGYPILLAKGDYQNSNGFAIFADPANNAIGFKINGQQAAQNNVNVAAMNNIAINWDGTILRFYVNGAEVYANNAFSQQVVNDTGTLTIGNAVSTGSTVGGLMVSKLVIANNANTTAIPSIYQALTTGNSGSNTHIPLTPAMGWPAGFGSGRVVFADDFNGSSLSNLWGAGMAGQSCGTTDHAMKQAEYPSADSNVLAMYTPSNILMGDTNGKPGNVILKAQYNSTSFGGGACGYTSNYTSGAVDTFPANYPIGASSGDGFAPSTGGFLWQEGSTDVIIQYKGSMPGANGAAYLWYGGWASSTPGWQFETDLNESAWSVGSGANAVKVPGTTTHYSCTGGSANDSKYSTGGWGTATNPVPGTEHIYTAWEHANGAVDMYMDGQLVGSNPPACNQNQWMGFLMQYGFDQVPSNFYPNWTSDQLTMDYVTIWQPTSTPKNTGIYHGGVAPGTTLPTGAIQ